MWWRFALVFCLLSPSVIFAQQRSGSSERLPGADKIIEKYLKVIGGRKRLIQVRDITSEWLVSIGDEEVGVARFQMKRPASTRSDLTLNNGNIAMAANASSAWSRGLDGELHTLTNIESATAKLQAVLDASHLVDYKKLNVAARVVKSDIESAAAVFAVEFSTRGGAHLLYNFSKATGLITKIQDDARKTSTTLADYRLENGLQQFHKLEIDLHGTGRLTLQLKKISYNSGIAANVFDAPAATESVDVAELLRVVAHNQDQLEDRFSEYSFMQKETDKEINSKGEVKKETVKVFEVFPIVNREPILKLVSENGVPLTGERAAKEDKRVQEEFLKADRDREKDEAKQKKLKAERQRKRGTNSEDNEDDVAISKFLMVCEFVSPRKERFRDREAVVFDFRPRPGFRPSNRQEELISKLVGVVWIDPADKQVMRLEAKLAEGFKMAGGLLFSLRPGAAFAMEQTRMQEGVWLPRLAQINFSMKVLLFGGGDMNKTIEWSDYRHFSGDVRDYKLETPKASNGENKP